MMVGGEQKDSEERILPHYLILINILFNPVLKMNKMVLFSLRRTEAVLQFSNQNNGPLKCIYASFSLSVSFHFAPSPTHKLITKLQLCKKALKTYGKHEKSICNNTSNTGTDHRRDERPQISFGGIFSRLNVQP